MINTIKKLILPGKVLRPIKNDLSSEPEIDSWEISEFILKKIIPIVGIRPFPLNELMLMISSLCLTNPDFVIEWGTHHGKSARIFYETTKYFSLQCKIHSIDLPPTTYHEENPGRNRGRFLKGIDEVELHLGDGLNISSRLTAKLKQNNKVFFFIDGDHSYDSVLRELNGINKFKLKKYILLHDTFYQSADSGYNIGPYKAIEKFNRKGKFKSISTGLGLPGMTFLYDK